MYSDSCPGQEEKPGATVVKVPMANNRSTTRNRNMQATVQWLALVVLAGLAILAAFTYFGGESRTGSSGLAPQPALTL